ncbi:hypothetical protein HPB51_005504 [Rhipicephalus microplus]|uniref:Ubiquitin-conjugating enzyme E2 Z n=1 Tax=Rhipicephalus microplus TaxID=6941 RepID=A0A9J6EXX6_RHIMP|nr:hypothetical protein HPB51_005504 [Rhipicephalus microplus]
MTTLPEQAPDDVASTSSAGNANESDDDTDNELLNSYVEVSSDSDDDDTDQLTIKLAMSSLVESGTKPNTSLKTADKINHAHSTTLSLQPNLLSFLQKMGELNHWEPTPLEQGETTPQCRSRAKRDIMDLLTDPPPGVYIAPCPPDYPIKPPRVRFMTTDAGRVRFNPNLYECGKVCLSILGTWSGPAWSPAQCIASVLISIQSLLSEKPYHNEPGYEKEKTPGDSKQYNLVVQHETIRVAVCDTVEACLKGSSECPPPLREVVLNSFPDYYDTYEKVVLVQHRERWAGSRMEFASERDCPRRICDWSTRLSTGALGERKSSEGAREGARECKAFSGHPSVIG